MNKSRNQNVFYTFSQPHNVSVSIFGPFYKPRRQISFLHFMVQMAYDTELSAAYIKLFT